MATNKIPRNDLSATIEHILHSNKIKDKEVITLIKTHVDKQIEKISIESVGWKDFKSFWPPRLLSAFEKDRFICFFGAGLSFPSGLPSWNALLTRYLKLDDKYIKDKDLEYDPLTLAEIASNYMGSENLQEILRKEFSGENNPVTNHYLTCMLRAPIYITTNYDTLFEAAWEVVNPTIELKIITNDLDLNKDFDIKHINNPDPQKAYLFKIHGSVKRKNEQLILTRRDYRLHYRSNLDFFNQIKAILASLHTLFIGFSHKDAEVTRLVEDAIYSYEKHYLKAKRKDQVTTEKNQPNFYSLQFDMLSHTPEIFAAKGIVAIDPPIISLGEDYRSIALNTALIELLLAASYNLSKHVSLEALLERAKKSMHKTLNNGIHQLQQYEELAKAALALEQSPEWMKKLQSDLGELAKEGVYLCNEEGKVINHEVPERYTKKDRAILDHLDSRPYFRQAKTFRKPFISDSFKSKFNSNSTFTVCLPLIEENSFVGLLFSACQIGNWRLPFKEAEKIWKQKNSFFIIDSNGNCLLPPNNEFAMKDSEGYDFDRLLLLSQKDKIISRVIENVMPINKDDDIINLSSSVKYYSLISDLRNTRWKIGVAEPIILDVQQDTIE